MESIAETEQELYEPSLSERFSLFTYYFNFYYTPLLCLFGGFGNCVSLYIFCRSSSHRNLSSSYYLSALAIADSFFLINCFALWVTTGLGYNVITTVISCPLVMYLSQVSCFMSVWLVVAFSVERYFAVCHPLTRPIWCTRARAKRVILAITLFALFAFSYAFLIAQVVEIPEEDERGGWGSTDSPTTNSTNWISSALPAYNNGRNKEATSLPATSEEELGLGNYNTFLVESNESSPGKDTLTSDSHNQMQTAQEKRVASSSTFTFASTAHDGLIGEDYGHVTSSFNSSDTAEHGREHEAENYTALFCTVPKKYHTFSRYANYADTFCTLILPFCIITFLNVRITICVWKLKGQRENIMAVSNFNKSSNRASVNHRQNCVVNITSETSPRNVSRFSCRFTKRKKSLDVINCADSNNPSNSTSPTINIDTTLGDTVLHQQQRGETGLTDSSLTVPTGTCPGSAEPHNNKARSNSANKVHTPTTMRKLASNHSNAAEVRVTKTLLLVSTVFLFLNLPSHALRMAAFIQEAFWPDSLNHGIDLSTFHSWAYILFNTNFGVNFLLYCVSGRNFRTSLYNLLCCANRRGQRGGHHAGPGVETAGGRILHRHQSNKRKANNDNPYIRNTASSMPGGGRSRRSNKRSARIRRRVFQSFTQCPSAIFGIGTNRIRKSQEINLRQVKNEDNKSDNIDTTSFAGGEGDNDRRSSIQNVKRNIVEAACNHNGCQNCNVGGGYC